MTFNYLISLTDCIVPCSPIHLNAGFLLLIAWHFSIKPKEESTFAISYSLLIFVFSFYSFWFYSSPFSWFSLYDIFFAASSKHIILFHVTNKCIPKDFSFLYFFILPPLLLAIFLNISASSSSDFISIKVGKKDEFKDLFS